MSSNGAALPVVSIVAGTETPVGEGVTAPRRCLVRYPDDAVRAAIVKSLAPSGVAAEAFCALLLRGWGLCVPDPALVKLPLSFASVELTFPNLKHRIGWSDSFPPPVKEALARQGARLVAGLSDTPRALAADEAIQNRDRNLGNILWDGSTAAWIDHERALGIVPMPDRNKLADMAISTPDWPSIQRSAVAVSLSLGSDAVNQALAATGSLPGTDEFAAQIAGSLALLAGRVLHRFPQPQDMFAARGGQPQ